MAGITDSKLGLRVLIGITIGILLGTGLLMYAPNGLQPGDVLSATTSDGDKVKVKLEADKAQVLAPILPAEVADAPVAGFATKVPIIGVPVAQAADALTQATRSEGSEPATTFTSVEVVERGKVVVRPLWTDTIYLIGQIFMRLLRMLVIPLVIVTILIGIASLGDIKRLGKLGGQAAFIYVSTMFVAVLIGVTMNNIFRPGDPIAKQGLWNAEVENSNQVTQTVPELLLRAIPENPVAAIADGDIVAILFFVILMALAMLKLGKRRVAPVFNFFEGMNDLVYVLVGWVMSLAPIGIAALIADTIATQEPSFLMPLLHSLGLFAATLTGALFLHFCFLIALVSIKGGQKPGAFLKTMSPVFATAFGTSSSSATLPVTLRTVGQLGISRRVSGFVVPVGATLNMDGTALFEAAGVLFFAQAFGFEFGFGQQMLVAFLSVIAAMGAAGIPSAGLVTMAIVLKAAGLPTSKIAVLFSIDRPLDMCRTVVNVTGDAVTSCIVQQWNPDIKQSEDEEFEEYEPVVPEASRDSGGE